MLASSARVAIKPLPEATSMAVRGNLYIYFLYQNTVPVYDMSSILCSQTQLHSKRFLCVIVSMHFALSYIQVSSAAFRLRRRSRCWESSASLWQEGSARTTPKTGPSTRSACARGDGWFPLVLLAMSPPKQNHLSNYLDELRVRYSYSWLLFSRRC